MSQSDVLTDEVVSTNDRYHSTLYAAILDDLQLIRIFLRNLLFNWRSSLGYLLAILFILLLLLITEKNDIKTRTLTARLDNLTMKLDHVSHNYELSLRAHEELYNQKLNFSEESVISLREKLSSAEKINHEKDAKYMLELSIIMKNYEHNLSTMKEHLKQLQAKKDVLQSVAKEFDTFKLKLEIYYTEKIANLSTSTEIWRPIEKLEKKCIEDVGLLRNELIDNGNKTLQSISSYFDQLRIYDNYDIKFQHFKTLLNSVNESTSKIENMAKDVMTTISQIPQVVPCTCESPSPPVVVTQIEPKICPIELSDLNCEADMKLLVNTLAKSQDTIQNCTNHLKELTEIYIHPNKTLTNSSTESSALDLMNEIETSLPDFAMRAAGSYIQYNMTTATYVPQGVGLGFQMMSWLGWEHSIGGPNEAITSGISPGQCWAMNGSKGDLTIRLLKSITPTAMTIEHVHRSQAVDLSTAPKDFQLWSSDTRHLRKLLVKGTFCSQRPEGDGRKGCSNIQTFNISRPVTNVQYVTLRILNNHGHNNYTCLYRLRVH